MEKDCDRKVSPGEGRRVVRVVRSVFREPIIVIWGRGMVGLGVVRGGWGGGAFLGGVWAMNLGRLYWRWPFRLSACCR